MPPSPRRLLFTGHLLAVLLFSLAAALWAAPSFDSKAVKMEADGRFTVAGLTFGLVLYDTDYVGDRQDSLQPGTGFPKVAAGSWETAGLWQPKSGGAPIKVTEKIDRLGDARFRVTYHVESPDGSTLNVSRLIACQAMLPAADYDPKKLRVDGTDLPLSPAAAGKAVMFDKWGSEILVIPTAQGNLTVEGDLKMHIQDDRPWHNEFFKLWFPIAQSSQAVSSADLSLTFTLAPVGK